MYTRGPSEQLFRATAELSAPKGHSGGHIQRPLRSHWLRAGDLWLRGATPPFSLVDWQFLEAAAKTRVVQKSVHSRSGLNCGYA